MYSTSDVESSKCFASQERFDRMDSVENPLHFVANLLRELGAEEDIKVDIEPTWQHVGRVTRRDGTVTFFRGAHFDLNGMGSMEIAVDKGYAAYFLKLAGYNVIPGRTFYSPAFDRVLKSNDGPEEAYLYAKEKIGFPVVVKPNSSTQGRLVCVVHDKRTFMQATGKICKMDRTFLVQPFMSGHDYRVVVLDNEVISAYERLPLTVVGDGKSTIDQLLDKKQKKYLARGRDTTIKKDDFRIDNRLKRHGLRRSTVLPDGELFALLDNRNLSTGGDAIDVIDKIDPSYRTLAQNIARDMGLVYCGVDLMIQKDIRKPIDPKKNNYHVIEINAAPGIDHYAQSGNKQKKIVKEMYRRILRKLAGVE